MINATTKRTIYKILEVCFILISVLVVIIFYNEQIIQKAANEKISAYLFNLNAEEDIIELRNGERATVSFTATREEISGISFKYKISKASDAQTSGIIRVALKKNNVVCQEWNTDINEALTKNSMELICESPVESKIGDDIEFEISVESAELSTQLILQGTKKEVYFNSQITKAGKVIEGTLAFGVLGKSPYISKMFWGISLILFALVLAVYLLIRIKRCRLERLFLLVGGILLVVYLAVFPPMSAPDEPGHIASAYAVADKLLMKESLDENGNTMIRKTDLIINSNHWRPDQSTYNLIHDNLFEHDPDLSPASYERGPINVPFWSYLPQAIGVALGMLLGLGGVATLYLGKLFAGIFYLLGCYWSIKKLPAGKMVLFIVALLPRSLELATSYSYDTIVNMLSFGLIGYCFYCAYNRKAVTWINIIILMVMNFFLAPVKIVYCVLAGLILLIPQSKFAKKGTKWMGTGLLLTTGILSIGIARMSSLSNMAQGQTYGGLGQEFESHTLPMLLQNIGYTIRMFVNTIRVNGDDYLIGMLGCRLTWKDLIYLPWMFAIAFFILLLLASAKTERDVLLFDWKEKVWMGCICAAVIGATLLALLLDFTPLGRDHIDGVQGRYFIPILPLIIFMFRSRVVVLKRNIDNYLVMLFTCIQVVAVLQVFSRIVGR